ncbi:hypothetical protein BDK51DRAFT_43515 [Blyttiomyces helicus]|uniref:Uncharacterized protein n=1 Tax=Blyttiomyces helicus TaxID=388810 RepID=A0A4P9WI22_9FUNG|nr:hypothetical protein BDK51DRAFT_43515 [Blyttiomyces helicus]|eukprot:RKO92052.1 hypothetical protein BDK51DRAFT_43515 [Blyttiomyces helicus]
MLSADTLFPNSPLPLNGERGMANGEWGGETATKRGIRFRDYLRAEQVLTIVPRCRRGSTRPDSAACGDELAFLQLAAPELLASMQSSFESPEAKEIRADESRRWLKTAGQLATLVAGGSVVAVCLRVDGGDGGSTGRIFVAANCSPDDAATRVARVLELARAWHEQRERQGADSWFLKMAEIMDWNMRKFVEKVQRVESFLKVLHDMMEDDTESERRFKASLQRLIDFIPTESQECLWAARRLATAEYLKREYVSDWGGATLKVTVQSKVVQSDLTSSKPPAFPRLSSFLGFGKQKRHENRGSQQKPIEGLV